MEPPKGKGRGLAGKVFAVSLLLLAFSLLCRFSRPVADFYSLWCYPAISFALSLLSSLVPVSLEEVVVILLLLTFIAIIVVARVRHKGFLWWFCRTAVFALAIVAWLYTAWCNNYFRSPLYSRLEIQRSHYSEEEFDSFLRKYSTLINESRQAFADMPLDSIADSSREFYASLDNRFGLCRPHSWQRIKEPLFNRFFSAVGVLGYMGPFLCEGQVNRELLPCEKASTAAHEMSHLLGVSSEAEAGFWAYVCCTASPDSRMHYSGYLSILGYVLSDARRLLPEYEVQQWMSSIDREVWRDYSKRREHWSSRKVPFLDRAQSYLFDKSLKANSVQDGIKDYNSVVGMIIFTRGIVEHELQRPGM